MKIFRLSICVIFIVFSKFSYGRTVNIPIPSLPTLDNTQFNIMLPKDRFKFITFWASWCLYCRKELPNLEELSKIIRVYGVDYKDDIFNAKRFLEYNGNPYSQVLFDVHGRLGISLGVRSLPTSLLLENNKEIALYRGAISLETVRLIRNYVNSKRIYHGKSKKEIH